MTANNQNQLGDREFSLRELWEALWQGKWTVFCITVGFAAIAAASAWLIPKRFDASLVMAPVSNSSGNAQLGGLSSLASQFGLSGLAGLASVGDTKKFESIALLQSEYLTERYIQENDLLPVIYAKRWDSQKKQWKVRDPKDIPTLWKANQDFKQLRTVNVDQKTGLVTLKITWKDPKTAAKWANDLVKLTNDFVRNRTIAESERNIAFLTDEAAKTSVVEARQAIYSVMEREINTVMLARGSEQYAFRILDPATVPEKAAFPQKTLWLFAGVFGGFFLGSSVVLLRKSWSSTLRSERTD